MVRHSGRFLRMRLHSLWSHRNKNNIYNFQSAFLTENVKDELEFVKFAFRYKKPSAFKNLFRHWYHYANNFKLPTDWIYQTLTFQRYNEIKYKQFFI